MGKPNSNKTGEHSGQSELTKMPAAPQKATAMKGCCETVGRTSSMTGMAKEPCTQQKQKHWRWLGFLSLNSSKKVEASRPPQNRLRCHILYPRPIHNVGRASPLAALPTDRDARTGHWGWFLSDLNFVSVSCMRMDAIRVALVLGHLLDDVSLQPQFHITAARGPFG